MNKLSRKVKLSLLALLSLALIFLANLLLIDAKSTRACVGDCGGQEMVTICHCERPRAGEPFQCQTLRISFPSAMSHIMQHSNDYWGECRQPTSTPPGCPGHPCPKPTQPQPTPTQPAPTGTQPTPTTAPSGDGGPGGGGPAGAPSCNAAVPGAPRLLSATYISSNEVKLIWEKVAGATHYSISYGPTSGNYPWGVPNTGDTNEFIVGELTSTCFIVRAVNDCAPSAPSNEICTGGGQVLGLSDTSSGSNYAYIIIGLASILFGTKLIKRENFI